MLTPGPIPDELALIEHLTDLDLSENQLEGAKICFVHFRLCFLVKRAVGAAWGRGG